MPDIYHPDNVQSFNSGAVGNPSAEQIWAFKSRQLAADMDLLKALAENMLHTVPSSRTQWHDGIIPIRDQLIDLLSAASKLCDATADAKPKQ